MPLTVWACRDSQRVATLSGSSAVLYGSGELRVVV